MSYFEPVKTTGLTTFQKVVILLSVGLFVASLFQPAFYIDRADYAAWADSKYLALFGWSGVLGGNAIASLIWLANPVYFLAIILLLRQKPAGFYLSIIAALIALSFSLLDSIIASESGSSAKITSLENGYYLWVASMITLVIGTAADRALNN